jgi:plastocyanin
MSRIPLLIAGVATMLVLAAPTAAGMSVTKLTGSVGPGYTISLKKGSAKVKTLTPGKYSITVNDKSAMHNFHLKGPGLNKLTTVPFKGTKTWTVTLKKGTYTYVCDPHAAIPSMKGTFKVA